MYHVILVEDEKFVLNYMVKMLKSFPEFIVEAAFSSPEEVLDSFDTLNAEVAFLDIEMPRMNGLELARKLTEKNHDLQIIFTTAYSKYAVDAFGVEAIDYLLKPINSEDILRVIKRLNKKNPEFVKAVGENSDKEELIKPYNIRCFGRFEIKDELDQIIKWPTKKAEEVFAYFLMHQGSYINKWELLDKFWPDMEEERGFHNLYNTIYRIKQVIRSLPASPGIEKINDGYVLKAEGLYSDIDNLKFVDEKDLSEGSLSGIRALCLSYNTPLFGTRDFIWSVALQENIARIYKRVCKKVIYFYRNKDDFEQAEEILRHFVKQHPESEDMMIWWFELLRNWCGREDKISEYKTWFNLKLSEMELPLL
ncbi:response regulator [Anaerocolumna sp. AGMB13025]|uniref:response regulator n=1 Tax=Anaerocolumna sp. AGMB13025 TaxID=3039116 RepID=UPI002F42BC9E